jgi:cation transport protein ChaC
MAIAICFTLAPFVFGVIGVYRRPNERTSGMSMWVFGYGSLLWNPGFDVAETVQARLTGYQRSFCMRSIHHRGTEDDPGLVLALDEHGSAFCDGVAMRVAPGTEEATLAYLRERELVSSAYLEKMLEIALADDRAVQAVTYVIDADHDQYCGGLPLEEQAQVIAKAVGGRGPNTEYLFNTVQHLDELGIADADLQWLCERVRYLVA